MDGYRQVGPDKGNYSEDIQNIAVDLVARRAVTLALTHRLTKQQVVVALLDGMVAVSPPEGCPRDKLWAFVAVVEHGAYWFDIAGAVAPSYIAHKLDVKPPDAETLSGFLGQLGHDVQALKVEA